MTVYLIRHQGDEAVKIGYTDGDPRDRLRAMQTGSASPLQLVASIPDAPREVERELHLRFAHLRLAGEWFTDRPEIRETFREHRAARHREHVVERAREAYGLLAEILADGTVPTGVLEAAVRKVGGLLAESPCDCGTSPAVARALLERQATTSTVQVFFEEHWKQLVRPFVPFSMLRALYAAWLREAHDGAKPVGAPQFTREIKALVDPAQWIVPQTPTGVDMKLATRVWLTEHEPVLDDYPYSEAVDRWQWRKGATGGGELSPSCPRQERGFMRKDVYAAWVAGGALSGTDAARAAVEAAGQRLADRTTPPHDDPAARRPRQRCRVAHLRSAPCAMS